MTSTPPTPDSDEQVTISRSDGWIVAKHVETGVSSQGRTRTDALENLADALELYERPVPEDEDAQEPSDAPWL